MLAGFYFSQNFLALWNFPLSSGRQFRIFSDISKMRRNGLCSNERTCPLHSVPFRYVASVWHHNWEAPSFLTLTYFDPKAFFSCFHINFRISGLVLGTSDIFNSYKFAWGADQASRFTFIAAVMINQYRDNLTLISAQVSSRLLPFLAEEALEKLDHSVKATIRASLSISATLTAPNLPQN